MNARRTATEARARGTNGEQGVSAKAGAFSEPGHRARLISNFNYNLVQELSELLSGAWRIDAYLKDAAGHCEECARIWQDVRKQKEFLIEKIRQEIAIHAKDGRFI